MFKKRTNRMRNGRSAICYKGNGNGKSMIYSKGCKGGAIFKRLMGGGAFKSFALSDNLHSKRGSSQGVNKMAKKKIDDDLINSLNALSFGNTPAQSSQHNRSKVKKYISLF